MGNKYYRKKIIFVAGILLFYSAIVLVGIRGTSSNLNQHHTIVEAIQASLQINDNLNENILRSRTFLLENYDPIVSDANQLREFCEQMMVPGSPLMKSQILSLQSALQSYCATVDRKLILTESFKSKNSILKNSFRYLRVLADRFESTTQEDMARGLLNEVFIYNMNPSTEQTQKLMSTIKDLKTQKNKQSSEAIRQIIENMALHLNILMRVTQDRKEIEAEILSDKVRISLNHLLDVYSSWYETQEVSASYYHYGLFALSALLGLILLNTFNDLHKKSSQLIDSNENLEKIVAERTSDLLAERNELQRKNETIENLQKISVQNAHQAGMSEIATGVLHNVGNVLNSANVGLEVIIQQFDKSVAVNLYKANDLLKQNQTRLGNFFTSDPRGEKLANFYLELGEALKAEMEEQKHEATELMKRLQLIKDIINTQQMYAKGTAEFKENISLIEVVENALVMQANALMRHEVKVVKKFSDVPPILAQRSKLIHVMLNLIKNAKESMATKDSSEKILTLEIGRRDQGGVFLKVTDTGMGIDKENLSKVFSHGFTTKQTGHGFGLHFCANSATEMDAKILASSNGFGKGACFTIEFNKIVELENAS